MSSLIHHSAWSLMWSEKLTEKTGYDEAARRIFMTQQCKPPSLLFYILLFYKPCLLSVPSDTAQSFQTLEQQSK